MEQDYPAAHSMDTTFFAVDSAGCVAVFDTGEAGALPLISLAGDEAYAALDRLSKLLPRCGALEDLAGRVLPGQSPEGEHTTLHTRSQNVLLFLDSVAPIAAHLKSGRAIQVPAAAPFVAVIWGEMTLEEHERFHASGECRSCFWYFGNALGGDEEVNSEYTNLGFFEYDMLTDNWIAGPYGRRTTPVRPVHIDQLPPDIRRELETGMTFDFKFADTPFIQPVDHEDCTAWGASYLDATGKHIRAIPDRAEDYPSEYAQLMESEADRQHFTIHPPEEDE